MNINKTYQYWRLHLFLTIYCGYVIYYFTRKSLTFAMPLMMDDMHLTYNDLGLLTTSAYVLYGLGKFFFGMLIDCSHSSLFMGLGLICSGTINILIGTNLNFNWIFYLWLINACFQSWGWPCCANILAHWYSRNERGFWWSVSNTSLNVGGSIVPIFIGMISLHYGWRSAFIIPGLFAIFTGFLLCILMRGTPKSMGLPSVGEWRNDPLEKEHENIEPTLLFPDKLCRYVLQNKFMWLLSGAYILIYIVRMGINDWGSIYLVRELGFDLISANYTIIFFEIGGLFGCLVAGFGSDTLFSGNRTPMTLIFSIGIFLATLCIWITPIKNLYILSICLFILGFFVFGPILLITMMASECSHKSLPATATGFIGAFGYIGAAIAGFPISNIIENYGWNAFFVAITLAATGIGLMVLPFTTLDKKKLN